MRSQVRFALAVGLLLGWTNGASATEKAIRVAVIPEVPLDANGAEHYQRGWKAFLSRFDKGTTEADVEKAMMGKFRDKGTTPVGGTGAGIVVYLIDDVSEIWLTFGAMKEGGRQLQSRGVLVKKHVWVRFPDGTIQFGKPAATPNPEKK